MRQWGIGLASYAAMNKGSFPPNTDAVDMSWIGQAMIDFSGEYLGQKLDGFTDPNVAREGQDHVMYCPTQEWHRYYREHSGWSPGNPELVGYFYFPYRAIPPENPFNGADYTPAGLSWVLKKKFYANDAPHAPILSDMIQQGGGSWGGPVPYSSHIEKNGNIPAGSNFMFEDGHVEWKNFDEIQIGGWVGGNATWYKIPIDP